MKRSSVMVLVLAALVAGWHAGRIQAQAEKRPLESGVITIGSAARADSGKWGEFRSHYAGPSPATADVLAGVAVILPGQENHPPHRHVDEEFMYLAEGSGTWHVDGKDIPAKAGDVLYSEPNVIHGLKNTSDKPLRFFVSKWRTK
jgi:quercetin dioxygenase-like cupin family protein